MSSVYDRVSQILVQQLGVTPEKVTPEANIADDLGADSLDMVEAVMAFEEEFGIEIPDSVVEEVKTVQDAVSCIEKIAA